MSRALHAEWTKLRTEPAVPWLLAGIVLATVLVSLLALIAAGCTRGDCDGDPVALSLTGVHLGQALVVLLAVLTIGGERGTGLLRITFIAVPRRTVVLTAKAVLVGGLAMAAGIVAVLGCVAAAWAILPGNGVELPSLRAALGSVLHLGLIGLLALGVAAAVRDSAASAGGVFTLLYAVPLVVSLINDPELQRALRRFAPLTAGLGVLAGWAAAALLLGALVLRRRDP